MDFVGEVIGFVGAWIEVMGLELALLLLFIGVVRYLTRKRPGQQPSDHSRPPHPSAYDDAYAAGGDFS
jgi:hypothetical protein